MIVKFRSFGLKLFPAAFATFIIAEIKYLTAI